MSYLLSPDVTKPSTTLSIVSPETGILINKVTGGIEFDHVDTDAEGISRLMRADGQQLEQYPGLHACFSWVTGNGVYGRCIVDGALVAFKPRPEDKPFVYTLMRLP